MGAKAAVQAKEMTMDLVGDELAPSPVVAVVGGGFSGLLTAVHLLRGSPSVQVHLIERGPRFGRGRAYSTANPNHLLNVRAANMSAFPDDPDHFRRWLGTPTGDVFVTRGRYGDYLQDILRQESEREGQPGRLIQHHSGATGALPASRRGWRVDLADGGAIEADAVVLALGFLEQTLPDGIEAGFVTHPAYIPDPWAHDPTKVPPGDILLLGTGLTMVDVAIGLDSPARRFTALSRRGLPPRVHGPSPASPSPSSMAGPLSCLRRLRRQAKKVGWRTAVDSIRWATPQIWQAWSQRERRQFLRHLQPWWGVHRHRTAPETNERLEAMRGDGRLQVIAAKVQSIAGGGHQLAVTLRPRGSTELQTRRYAAVINCTSPSSDIDGAKDPLVAGLRRQGLLRADALGLGLDVARDWGVVGAGGRKTQGLYAVGPLARGEIWEAVAVPDLRLHAQEAAGFVLGALDVRPDQKPLSAVRGA
jgi:uncharacterized NAD(P)/FAD-binding protein YdhS